MSETLEETYRNQLDQIEITSAESSALHWMIVFMDGLPGLQVGKDVVADAKTLLPKIGAMVALRTLIKKEADAARAEGRR